MAKSTLRHLWTALDFKLSELLQPDLWFGLLAGGATVAIALIEPAALLRAVVVASGLVGVIIGAVIAGVAVQAAFFDQAFLRKIRAIGRDPVRYVAPFLFTAVIGVMSMIGLLTISTMSAATHPAVLATVSGFTGFFTVWTIISLLPCLATLVQFISLKMDALDVPDDIEVPRRRNDAVG